jgi:hypothetical protein
MGTKECAITMCGFANDPDTDVIVCEKGHFMHDRCFAAFLLNRWRNPPEMTACAKCPLCRSDMINSRVILIADEMSKEFRRRLMQQRKRTDQVKRTAKRRRCALREIVETIAEIDRSDESE